MGPVAHPSALSGFGYTSLEDVFENHEAAPGVTANLRDHSKIVLVTAST
jgi:hypothetical protein